MNLAVQTPHQLLREYEQGRITALGVIMAVLTLSGKRRLSMALQSLSPDLVVQLKHFLDEYRPRTRVFHGPQPKAQAIRFAREWISCHAPTH